MPIEHQSNLHSDIQETLHYLKEMRSTHDQWENRLGRIEHSLHKKEIVTNLWVADLGVLAGTTAPFILFPGGIHLRDGINPRFVYIENHGATAKLFIYGGTEGTGLLLSTLVAVRGKVIPIPDAITGLSIVSSVNNDTGLVHVFLTTEVLNPTGLFNV